jgi:hypothetical protein
MKDGFYMDRNGGVWEILGNTALFIASGKIAKWCEFSFSPLVADMFFKLEYMGY